MVLQGSLSSRRGLLMSFSCTKIILCMPTMYDIVANYPTGIVAFYILPRTIFDEGIKEAWLFLV